jgi:hypothetical protein
VRPEHAGEAASAGGDGHSSDQYDGGEATANEDDGGDGDAFSIFDFFDVLSSSGYDPAGNDEGRQFLADAASQWLVKSARVWKRGSDYGAPYECFVYDHADCDGSPYRPCLRQRFIYVLGLPSGTPATQVPSPLPLRATT